MREKIVSHYLSSLIIFLCCASTAQQVQPLYLSCLPLDLKKEMSLLLTDLSDSHLHKIIDRNDETELAHRELWLLRLVHNPIGLQNEYSGAILLKKWNSVRLFARWGYIPHPESCKVVLDRECNSVLLDKDSESILTMAQIGVKVLPTYPESCWAAVLQRGSQAVIIALIKICNIIPKLQRIPRLNGLSFDPPYYGSAEFAVRTRNPNALEAILMFELDTDDLERAWLKIAAWNNLQLAQLLRANGHDMRDSVRKSALFEAANHGSYEMVQFLLDRVKHIDKLEHYLESPLKEAVRVASCHDKALAIIKLFLGAGADPSSVIRNSFSDLHSSFWRERCYEENRKRIGDVFAELLQSIKIKSNTYSSFIKEFSRQHEPHCLKKYGLEQCLFCSTIATHSIALKD